MLNYVDLAMFSQNDKQIHLKTFMTNKEKRGKFQKKVTTGGVLMNRTDLTFFRPIKSISRPLYSQQALLL